MFFFPMLNEVFSGEKEKEFIIHVIEKSIPQDHHLPSLGKPCDAKW